MKNHIKNEAEKPKNRSKKTENEQVDAENKKNSPKMSKKELLFLQQIRAKRNPLIYK